MEIWKDVKGYEGSYQVSNYGRVKSFRWKEPKILTPKCGNTGRLSVQLMDGKGKAKYKLIHRLVGEAFIPNPDDLPLINHKDENPKNNRVENLEWCTQSYNVRYSYALHPERAKKHRGNGKHKGNGRTGKFKPYKYEQKVVQCNLDGEPIKVWDNIATIARESPYHNYSIKECCLGKRKTAYGYKWHFA